jgi:hypothetical protein
VKIRWENLTDEMIERADSIEVIDPGQRRALQIWIEGSAGVLPGYPARRMELEVLLGASDFGKLISRVREIKGRLPALIENLNL